MTCWDWLALALVTDKGTLRLTLETLRNQIAMAEISVDGVDSRGWPNPWRGISLALVDIVIPSKSVRYRVTTASLKTDHAVALDEVRVGLDWLDEHPLC
jgi:hypothetical protein